MDEDAFWALVAQMGGDPGESGCHRLYLALRRLSAADVLAFDDRLAEVLHRLDVRPVARQRWRDVDEPWWLPRLPFISADGFLYARCAAVAAGRETVEGILVDHRRFRRRWDLGAERLLSVAADAYEGVTGRQWPEDHVPPYSYETGSNPAGGWRHEGTATG